MALGSRLSALAQRVGTEFKTIRSTDLGGMKVKSLTKAQYAALATPHPTLTRYYISDWTTDASSGTTSGGGTTTGSPATLVPSAAGSKLTGWNYEGTPDYTKLVSNDGASSSIYSPTANDIVTYQMTDLPSGAATVTSVTVHNWVMKVDPVTATTHCVLVIGGTVYESPDQSPASNTAYEDLSYTWSTNPATGAVWTVAAVNALEAGIKKINSAGERCTAISAVVAYA